MDGPKINITKLKRDIIASTGEGKAMSRRKLSLLATGGKNPDLVRDFISRDQDKKVSSQTLIGLATALGKDPAEYYVGVTPTPQSAVERIPVIGRVQAGMWSEHPEWDESDWYYIEVDPSPVDGAERFALEMVGHSMDRIILSGSILECLRVFNHNGLVPRDGDIVIVQRQQGPLVETTCKRLEIAADGQYVLHCESTREEFREPLFMGKPDPDHIADNDIRIIGIVDKATQNFFRRRHN